MDPKQSAAAAANGRVTNLLEAMLKLPPSIVDWRLVQA